MKAHMKRTRAIRALAIAGSLAALAVPTAAVAMPDGAHPRHAPGWQGGFANQQQPYSLPAGFATDTQSSAQSSAEPAYTLPSGFQTDAQSSPPPSSAPSQPVSVVREIRTVVNDSGRTLAIVLAAVALGIALCGTAYVAARLAIMQRRVPTSNS